MKILFLLPYFDEAHNSFSKLLVPILNELKCQDIPFEILSSNKSYKGCFQSHHYSKFFPNFKLGFITFPLNLMVGTLLAWRWKRKNPDGIVHNIGGGNSLIHDVVTAHACHAQYLKFKILYGELWRVFVNPIHAMILLTEWFNYRRKPRVISVSHYNTAGLHQYHKKLKGRVTTIENATSQSDIAVSTPPKSGQFRILFASNNHSHKGLNYMLEALEISKNKKLNWHLAIAGLDPYQSHWQKRVRKRKLSSMVSFLGHCNDLGKVMAESHIYCMPSMYESFGMVFLEAAKIGCPVYGSDVGILAKLYQGFNGPSLCQHPVSGRSVFEGLKFFADHPNARYRFKEHLKKRAAEYSIKNMTRQTISIYRGIIQQSIVFKKKNLG